MTNIQVTPETRLLIERAQELGTAAEEAVRPFCEIVSACLYAFNAELGPLALSEDDYHTVEISSGLHAVLTMEAAMQRALEGVYNLAPTE